MRTDKIRPAHLATALQLPAPEPHALRGGLSVASGRPLAIKMGLLLGPGGLNAATAPAAFPRVGPFIFLPVGAANPFLTSGYSVFFGLREIALLVEPWLYVCIPFFSPFRVGLERQRAWGYHLAGYNTLLTPFGILTATAEGLKAAAQEFATLVHTRPSTFSAQFRLPSADSVAYKSYATAADVPLSLSALKLEQHYGPIVILKLAVSAVLTLAAAAHDKCQRDGDACSAINRHAAFVLFQFAFEGVLDLSALMSDLHSWTSSKAHFLLAPLPSEPPAELVPATSPEEAAADLAAFRQYYVSDMKPASEKRQESTQMESESRAAPAAHKRPAKRASPTGLARVGAGAGAGAAAASADASRPYVGDHEADASGPPAPPPSASSAAAAAAGGGIGGRSSPKVARWGEAASSPSRFGDGNAPRGLDADMAQLLQGSLPPHTMERVRTLTGRGRPLHDLLRFLPPNGKIPPLLSAGMKFPPLYRVVPSAVHDAKSGYCLICAGKHLTASCEYPDDITALTDRPEEAAAPGAPAAPGAHH
jgi:hypothetical protein